MVILSLVVRKTLLYGTVDSMNAMSKGVTLKLALEGIENSNLEGVEETSDEVSVR